MFYVAVTRAKERLALVTYDSEFGKKTDGFDFIATLLCEKEGKRDEGLPRGAKETEKLALGYFEGDVIWHRVFGEGVISSIKGDRAEVKFYKYRCPKSIDLRYCIVNRLIRSV